MTKEQFISLGLTEEQATKAAEESAKELTGYTPTHRFEEVNTENKNLKDTIKNNDKALEDLKKVANNSEELQKQLQKLQDDKKEEDKKHQEELKELKLNNAIKLAIAGNVHNEDIVAGLFDKSKLILGDDGKVTGLDEQLKGFKESHAFLFKTESEETKPGFRPKVGGEPQDSNTGGNSSMNFKDAVASHYQQASNK